jgi:polar amino acid transport system substrate-binding protein
MKSKRIVQIILVFILIAGMSCGGGSSKKIDNMNTGNMTENTKEEITAFMRGESKNLIASMGNLPGLAETPDKGAFIDLVKALDDVYTDGTIKIEVYPFTRSFQNLLSGKADFHIPTPRNPELSEENFPYRTVSESMGTVVIVLYSNIDNIITRKIIDDAVEKGGEFPYTVECSGHLKDFFAIPIINTNDLSNSFQKLQNKRIDALLWAQEESDLVIRDLKLNKIYRSPYGNFDDAIMISKRPEADKIDEVLSEALKKIKASGKHQEIYKNVHTPYDDWQPSEMGWE